MVTISNIKFLSCFLISLSTIASISAKEIPNYGNISIKAEYVTLNKFTNKLLLKTNIQINFGEFILSGDSAIVSYDEEKLVIDGSPASILSQKNNINGVANQFIIYPNLSMEMLGDARLQQKDQSIYAEQITYQISLR
jgi:lipopolysaccharide export system protein LptA